MNLLPLLTKKMNGQMRLAGRCCAEGRFNNFSLNGARGKPGNFFVLRAPGIAQMLVRQNADVVLVTRHFRARRPVQELDGSERGRLDQTARRVEQECQ